MTPLSEITPEQYEAGMHGEILVVEDKMGVHTLDTSEMPDTEHTVITVDASTPSRAVLFGTAIAVAAINRQRGRI